MELGNGLLSFKILLLENVLFSKVRKYPGEYFLVCAAKWGRIFTTGLTIMGLHFKKSYWSGVIHFPDFGGQKIQVCTHLKIEKFTPH